MFFDTHAHLDQEEFDADRSAVIERARQSGVELILAVGIDLASSRRAVRLAEDNADIFAAVGIHPNSAAEAHANDWDRIVELAAHPRVVAIGETGLDRFRDYAPFPLQQEYFERHLTLARQRDLPIVIHCRDAADDLMPMLRRAAAHAGDCPDFPGTVAKRWSAKMGLSPYSDEAGGLSPFSSRPLKGVMHAFSGDARMARECVEMGLHVSFAGNVTYKNKKFQDLRLSAQAVPLERMLVETDSPYLVPEPLRGKERRNEPSYIAHAAQCLAKLREMPLAELARQTTANARGLFGISEKKS